MELQDERLERLRLKAGSSTFSYLQHNLHGRQRKAFNMPE